MLDLNIILHNYRILKNLVSKKFFQNLIRECSAKSPPLTTNDFFLVIFFEN